MVFQFSVGLQLTLPSRWRKLEEKINEIQEAATATVSTKDIPVNNKLELLEDELNELTKALKDQSGIIKNEEELDLYIERLQVCNWNAHLKN